MAYVRKETVGNFSEEELLQMVKDSLEELGIAYEEKPGGFGEGPFLDPGVFDEVEYVETFTIRTCASRSPFYRPQGPITYDLELPFTNTWEEDGQAFLAA